MEPRFEPSRRNPIVPMRPIEVDAPPGDEKTEKRLRGEKRAEFLREHGMEVSDQEIMIRLRAWYGGDRRVDIDAIDFEEERRTFLETFETDPEQEEEWWQDYRELKSLAKAELYPLYHVGDYLGPADTKADTYLREEIMKLVADELAAEFMFQEVHGTRGKFKSSTYLTDAKTYKNKLETIVAAVDRNYLLELDRKHAGRWESNSEAAKAVYDMIANMPAMDSWDIEKYRSGDQNLSWQINRILHEDERLKRVTPQDSVEELDHMQRQDYEVVDGIYVRKRRHGQEGETDIDLLKGRLLRKRLQPVLDRLVELEAEDTRDEIRKAQRLQGERYRKFQDEALQYQTLLHEQTYPLEKKILELEEELEKEKGWWEDKERIANLGDELIRLRENLSELKVVMDRTEDTLRGFGDIFPDPVGTAMIWERRSEKAFHADPLKPVRAFATQGETQLPRESREESEHQTQPNMTQQYFAQRRSQSA